MQGHSNLIAIENLDARYLGTQNIENDHSLGWAEIYVSVIGAGEPLRARFSVKLRTKVIPTATTVNDGERVYLRCQGWFVCFDEQPLEFPGQFGQRFDE